MNKKSALLCSLFAIALTACGGGSDSGGGANTGNATGQEFVNNGSPVGAGGSTTTTTRSNGTTTTTRSGTTTTLANSGGTAGSGSTGGGSTPGSDNPANQTPVRWEITDIGQSAQNLAVANTGKVLVSMGGPFSQTYIWENGQATEIKRSDANTVIGTSINDAGEVAGCGSTVVVTQTGPMTTNTKCFVYRNGEFKDLDYGPYTQASGPILINNSGQVVATALLDGIARPVLFSNGSRTDLGNFKQAPVFAAALNDKGDITGTVQGSRPSAFLYSNGKYSDVGNFSADDYIGASAINNEGQILGNAMTADSVFSFLYSGGVVKNMGLTDLYGINDSGQIVGGKDIGDKYHAVLISGDKSTDLNTLPGVAGSGWELITANSINNRGQIVGKGRHNSESRSFLLTPVFE